MAPVIYILENKFSYGCEFYGNQVGIAMTSITERCFLTMSQVTLLCSDQFYCTTSETVGLLIL